MQFSVQISKCLLWFGRFALPLGVWEGLRFVIVALPGLFSYLLCNNIKSFRTKPQVKLTGKCQNHEAQPSRDTKRMKDEDQTMTKQTITITRLFKDIENFTTKNFSDKNSDFFFHISAQNIYCGYSRRGGSNEYPQSMFLSRNKKNTVYPYRPRFYYIKVGFKGVKIIKACFRDGHITPTHEQ